MASDEGIYRLEELMRVHSPPGLLLDSGLRTKRFRVDPGSVISARASNFS
jgi:hypothetical protein